MDPQNGSIGVDGATDPSANPSGAPAGGTTASTGQAAQEESTKKDRKKAQRFDPRPAKDAAQALLDKAKDHSDSTVVGDVAALRQRLDAFDSSNVHLIAAGTELTTKEGGWLEAEGKVRDALLPPVAQLRGTVSGGNDVLHRSKARSHFETATNLLKSIPDDGLPKLDPVLVRSLQGSVDEVRPALAAWAEAQTVRNAAEKRFMASKQELQNATSVLRLALARYAMTQPKVRKPRKARKAAVKPAVAK